MAIKEYVVKEDGKVIERSITPPNKDSSVLLARDKDGSDVPLTVETDDEGKAVLRVLDSAPAGYEEATDSIKGKIINRVDVSLMDLQATHASHQAELNLKTPTVTDLAYCASSSVVVSSGGTPFDFRNKPKKYLKIENKSQSKTATSLRVVFYATTNNVSHMLNERLEQITLPNLAPGESVTYTSETPDMEMFSLPFPGIAVIYRTDPDFQEGDNLKITLIGGL